VSPTQIPFESVSPGEKIRCVLVHDHVLLRQGLRRLLEDEPDLEVVSEAGNAAEAARKVFEFRPDVVIADAATFALPAPEVELFLLRESPKTKVLFLSMLESAGCPPSEPTAEAVGCVVRQTSSEELATMVRSACNPRAKGLRGPFLASVSPQLSGEAFFPRKRSLTAREREVLKLLAEGRTVRAVAALLNLSVKTVDAHKFNLMRKLGIHNKAELVMWAIQKRVVKIPANF
jgi:two-component system, NarL family, response regulator NreC